MVTIGRLDYRDGSVQLDSPFFVTFNDDMDAGSIVLTASPQFNFAVEWLEDQFRSIAVTPTADMAGATTYTLTIDGTNQAGVPIAPPYEFTFHTQAVPDRTPAAVTSIVPMNGASSVSPDTRLSVSFNEPMFEVVASIEPELLLGTPSTSDSRTFTFDMSSYTWAPGQQYFTSLYGTDLCGNETAIHIQFTGACLMLNEACSARSECCSGLCGSDGGCQACLTQGEPCSDYTDCCSSSCGADGGCE